MTTRPTDLPLWDTNDTNSVKPATALIEDGYTVSSVPAAEEHNWIFQTIGDWVRALKAQSATDWQITEFDPAPNDDAATEVWLTRAASQTLLFDDKDEILELRDGTPRGDLVKAGPALASGVTPTMYRIGDPSSSGIGVVERTSPESTYILSTPITDLTAGTLGTDLEGASSLTGADVYALTYHEGNTEWYGAVGGVNGSTTTVEIYACSTVDISSAWASVFSEAVPGTPRNIAQSGAAAACMPCSDGSVVVTTDGSNWTRTTGHATEFGGVVWRAQDGSFYAIGSASGLPALYSIPVSTAPTVTEVSLASLDVGAGTPGSYGGIAVDDLGGLMVTYTLFAGNSDYENHSQLRCAYWPPGRVPGTDDPIDVYVAPVLEGTPGASATAVGARAWTKELVYDPTSGQFIGLIQVYVSSGNYSGALAYTRPLRG